jgi:hypothetical protein
VRRADYYAAPGSRVALRRAADGADDGDAVYDAVAEHHPEAVVITHPLMFDPARRWGGGLSKPPSVHVPTQQLGGATASQRQPGEPGFTPHPPGVEL